MKMDQLFGKPITFHRWLVPIAGTQNSTIFLEQAIAWTETAGPEGWFTKTQKEWEAATSLTQEQQEVARGKLKSKGILQERPERLQHILWYKVDMNTLRSMAKSQLFPETGKVGFGGPENPVSPRAQVLLPSITENTEDNIDTKVTNTTVSGEPKSGVGDAKEERIVEYDDALVNQKTRSSFNRPLSVKPPRAYRGGEIFDDPMVAKFIEEWNSHMMLPKLKSMVGREKDLALAMKDAFFRLNWIEGIRTIAASRFCCGVGRLAAGERKPWKANYDWFIKRGTLVKILEGKYDDPKKGEPEKKFDVDDF